ncbi:MAG: hypothetical protein GXO55_08380 [Chloroflexi bacterium]|nr:hypothetical protein [Chloroflexota bacterium]
MDLAQLEQMVTWLDQQRRRADQDLRQLEQQLTHQAGVIEEQSRRIQQLEGELASARAQLAEYNALQQALDNIRKEVRASIERIEEERLARERDQERLRAAEREKWGRDIAELRKMLERIHPLEEAIESRKVEERRLNEAILQLRELIPPIDRRVEDVTRTVTLLKEQRSQDHRRIGQLQGETVELFRRLEALAGKLPLLEEKIQRQEKIIQSVQELAESLKQSEQTFLEEVRQAELGRQQTMALWEKSFERMEAQLAEALGKLEAFQLQYDKAAQAVADIERWQTELRRDVHEIREAQRLAEEHVRRQVREFEEEMEKRWKKVQLEWNYKWEEQTRQLESLKQLLETLQQQLGVHVQLLDILWRLQEEWGSQQLAEAQRLLQLIEETASKWNRASKELSR